MIETWGDIDADICAFIQEFSKAPSTARSHESGWSTWVAHCRQLGVDPMAAPFSAFEDLLLRRRVDGHVYTRGSHDIVLAAVGVRYAEAGAVPAHKEPANVGAWRTLMKGATREANDRKRAHPGSARQWEVEPLLREDVVAMLTTTPDTTVKIDAWVAATLLAVDGQMAARELARLRFDEVQDLQDGGVRVGSGEFTCDHAERVRGVPWDCTACAVRAVVTHHPGTGPLLAAASDGDLVQAMSQRLSQLRDRTWAGVPMDRSTSGWRSTRLTPASALSGWQAAGFRRACVLSVGRRGEAGTWLRARAWTAMAWSCGFRMCGDLLRLNRLAVSADPNGAGYRIDLAGTKDDPHGDKQAVRPLAWGDGAVSVASLVAEYLCVRDAVHGTKGSLIVGNVLTARGVAGGGVADGGRGTGGGTGVARNDLRMLCELAGLSERRYSSYSTRKGFSRQAYLDGWSVEEIRDALRHQTLGVTLNSYLAAGAAKEVSTKLIRNLGRTA